VRDTGVAARYAKALFLVTEKRGQTTAALEDLQGVCEVLRPGTPVAGYFSSPQLRMTDKREALKRSLHGRALPIVAVFTDLLLRKKRLGELLAILEEFRSLVERAQGIQRAHVVSAVPLTRDEMNRLVPELERVTGATMRMTSEVDPTVLGGVRVRIGDRVIDRTVRTLLESISKQLYEASV
jgi:F-type H+-transporting ATPase subunit delta